MVAERYHRPPIVGSEGSLDDGVWRFRLAFGLVILALLVGAFFLVRWLVQGTNEGNPGVGAGRPVAVVSAPAR